MFLVELLFREHCYADLLSVNGYLKDNSSKVAMSFVKRICVRWQFWSFCCALHPVILYRNCFQTRSFFYSQLVTVKLSGTNEIMEVIYIHLQMSLYWDVWNVWHKSIMRGTLFWGPLYSGSRKRRVSTRKPNLFVSYYLCPYLKESSLHFKSNNLFWKEAEKRTLTENF